MKHQDQLPSLEDKEIECRFAFRDYDGDITMLNTNSFSEQSIRVMDCQLSQELALVDSCIHSDCGIEYNHGDFLITWKAGSLWCTIGLPLVAQMVRLLEEWRDGTQE